MATEREVAGLRCGEVLAELSNYLDGDLDAVRRAQVDAHLQGCDVCERFGGVFAAAIRALRDRSREIGPEDTVVFERLRARLDQV
jgi:anti-sigma factor RsiW